MADGRPGMMLRRSLNLVELVARRVLDAIPTVLGIIVIDFILLRFVPGDAADAMAGESGAATAQTMAALRARFGLDLPAMEQLWRYLTNLAHLNLGISPRYNIEVATLIGERLPATLLLMLVAFVIAFTAGLLLGMLMTVYARRLPDRVAAGVSMLFYSIPSFWIALMLIVLFSVHLGWLPSGGTGLIGAAPRGLLETVLSKIRYMTLPALSLALAYVGIYARLTRTAMMEVRSQDYVRTAVAKGVAPFWVVLRHILRNALIPVTTVAGMHLGGMLGGAVVVETVYSWPGLGSLAFEAVVGRDFNVLLGILLMSSLVVIVVNIGVDLLHAWLDPRLNAG